MGDRQLGFAEAFLDPRMLAAGKLAGLAEVIDWGPVEALAEGLHGSALGRPPYPGAAMLRALYLQALYDLMTCPIRGWRRRFWCASTSACSAASR